MALNPIQLAQRYFDAWNQHDAAAIVATFAQGGTYLDPVTQGPISGSAIGVYAESLWASFPDLSFEILSLAQNDSGLVCAEWLMKGANTAPFQGLPPTGIAVTLSGADFLRVEEGGIRSVQGYFDSGALPRALGLDVIVQPRSIGPFGFGVSTRVSGGSKAVPAAFSITFLEAASEEARLEIRESSRKIAQEMLSMPGFISWVGATVGDRMMTVTAWESPEAMEPLMQGGEHRSAVGRFFGSGIARGGATGVWTPSRLNPRWVCCQACGKMAATDGVQAVCACGSALPAPSAYW